VKDEYGIHGGVWLYGRVTELPNADSQSTVRKDGLWTADYAKTLCPRCQTVLKDIILNSNLSNHWHKYDWKSDMHTECYDE
jgi:hypothetical protein